MGLSPLWVPTSGSWLQLAAVPDLLDLGLNINVQRGAIGGADDLADPVNPVSTEQPATERPLPERSATDRAATERAAQAIPPVNPTEGVPGARARAVARGPQPTPKEIEEAMGFMKTHSPVRFKTLESMPDGERKFHLKNVATRLYMQLIRSTPVDRQDLMDIAIKRTETEDAVFGLAVELRNAPADKREAIKAQLKDSVATLVTNSLKERELRLVMLQHTVEVEQQQLTRDKARQDALIDERLNAVLTSGDKGLAGYGLGEPKGGASAPRGRSGKNAPADGTPPQ